jgi:hypothetical protein
VAGVLSSFLTAYRTALTTAGLTKAPASMLRMDNLPVSNLHRVFRLYVIADGDSEKPYGGSGSASLQDIEAEVGVDLHWNPQVNADTIETTIADDIKSATQAMVKASNRTLSPLDVLTASQGIVEVWTFPGQSAFRISGRGPNEITAEGRFSVRYRETRDLS